MATILTRRLHTQIAHDKVLKSRTNTHLSKWQTVEICENKSPEATVYNHF